MRDLRIGVGAPRHHQRRELLAADRAEREERVLHRDLRRRVGRMRELPAEADVARGVDARVAGAERVVHAHAAARRTRRPHPRGRAPRRWAPDRRRRRISSTASSSSAAPARAKCRRFAPSRRDTRWSVAPWTTRIPSSAKRRSRKRCDVGVLARQQVRVGVQHHHLGAEAPERLRHLAADRTGADHAEARGPLGQVEERLVGQIAGLGQARDRRRGGARAGRDDGAREAQAATVRPPRCRDPRSAPRRDTPRRRARRGSARPSPRG